MSRPEWIEGDLKEALRGVPFGELGLVFETLETFAATDEPGAEPIVADAEGAAALPAGGTAMVYGGGGAGKTTMILDQIIAWSRDETWCGLLTPSRKLRVLVIENEGPRPPLRLKVQNRLQASPGGTDGLVRVMSEPWQRFTFADETMRNELVCAIDEHDADLVVAGPLSRIGMEGPGTLDEIRRFMELVELVQGAARRRPCVELVHHENRAGQVSGAWEPNVDTLVHVQGQGHGRTRVLWQKMRWSSSLHATTTHLVWAPGETFVIEEREKITEEIIAEAILEGARANPGASWTKIRETVKGKSLTEATSVRDRLIVDGLLVNVPKRKNGFNLWTADDPALNRSEAGTDAERIPFPSPERATGAFRSTVLPLGRTVTGTERTGQPGSALDELFREAAERGR